MRTTKLTDEIRADLREDGFLVLFDSAAGEEVWLSAAAVEALIAFIDRCNEARRAVTSPLT